VASFRPRPLCVPWNVSAAMATGEVGWQGRAREEEDEWQGIRLYNPKRSRDPALGVTKFRGVLNRRDLVPHHFLRVDFQRKVSPGDSFEVLLADEGERRGKKSEVAVRVAHGSGEKRARF